MLSVLSVYILGISRNTCEQFAPLFSLKLFLHLSGPQSKCSEEKSSSTNRITDFYPCTEILRLSGEVLRHLPAAGGEIQNSSSSHVCCLHVMSIVKAALAAGTAGTAASTTTHIAAAARGITACCAAGWT